MVVKGIKLSLNPMEKIKYLNFVVHLYEYTYNKWYNQRQLVE